jgi:hypothetical protein
MTPHAGIYRALDDARAHMGQGRACRFSHAYLWAEIRRRALRHHSLDRCCKSPPVALPTVEAVPPGAGFGPVGEVAGNWLFEVNRDRVAA